jgi:hypothetical protein
MKARKKLIKERKELINNKEMYLGIKGIFKAKLKNDSIAKPELIILLHHKNQTKRLSKQVIMTNAKTLRLRKKILV